MPHEIATFEFWSHVFIAALGAGLLYMQWGRSKLRAFAFSDILDTFKLSAGARIRLEMIIFVAVGTTIAIALTRPSTMPQAFSAGLGWTGLAARPNPSESKSPKKVG